MDWKPNRYYGELEALGKADVYTAYKIGDGEYGLSVRYINEPGYVMLPRQKGIYKTMADAQAAAEKMEKEDK